MQVAATIFLFKHLAGERHQLEILELMVFLYVIDDFVVVNDADLNHC